MQPLLHFLFGSTRRLLALITLTCLGLLGYVLYLQHTVGLEPCPMCVVQRYLFVMVAICAALGSLWGRRGWMVFWGALTLIVSGFGAYVAASQSWMQWFPPEIVTCGRDFYGIVENYPISRAIPMLFRGSGSCTEVDWTFLGLSIANWSFVWFFAIAVALLVHWRFGKRW